MPRPSISSDWMATWDVLERGKAAANLICFPYAGATHAAFAGWAESFFPEIQVHAVKLPGRGVRFSEKALRSLDDIAVKLSAAISLEADGPLIFYGECTGAVMAYATAQKLRLLTGRSISLFCASRAAPPSLPRKRRLSDLPAQQFKAAILDMKLFDPELLADDIVEFYLDQIRADFTVVEGWNNPGYDLLNCPIVTFADGLGSLSALEYSNWETEGRSWHHVALTGSVTDNLRIMKRTMCALL